MWWCDFLDRKRCGAPPGGCNGTAGSGVTVCTGRGGLSVNFFKLATRLSHINETSSIRCKTYKQQQKFIIYFRQTSFTFTNKNYMSKTTF